MRKSSIFNKNLKVDKKHLLLSVKNNQILIHKVSKCGQSGCKKEQLTPREVERVIIFIFNYPDHTCCANNSLLSWREPRHVLCFYLKLWIRLQSKLVECWHTEPPKTTRCSFSGRLASDPESTAYISGCPNEETMDISLMSKKVDNFIVLYHCHQECVNISQMSKYGEKTPGDVCVHIIFYLQHKHRLSKMWSCCCFYQTQVRSLSTPVSNYLTHWLLLVRLERCDSGWRVW